jgi:hypothetical protein
MDFQIIDVVPAKSARPVVYLAEFGDVTKVGVSTNPRQRLTTLAGASGRACGRVAVGGASDAYANERLILADLGADRLNGTEWVSLSFDEVLSRALGLAEAPYKSVAGDDGDPERLVAFMKDRFGEAAERRDEVFYDFLRAHGPRLMTMGQTTSLRDAARHQASGSLEAWVEKMALASTDLHLDEAEERFRVALVENYITALKAKLAEVRAA